MRAAALAAASASAGCRPGSGRAAPSRKRRQRLKILQVSHSVPGYDRWFDDHVQRWGAANDVDVAVDRLPVGRLVDVAAAEVAARRGHDLFGFLGPPAAFEDHVIDHRHLIEEAEAKLGGMVPLVRRSIYNPKTHRYVGFCDSWAPAPALWRRDLWAATALEPATWADVLGAAPHLKAEGHPLGIGLSQDLDSNMALLSLMACFGSFIQDEESRVTLDCPETIEVVKFAAALFRAGMTDEVFAWDALSNNRFLAAGRGSLILNPVSALRSIEWNNPELARNIAVSPVPSGPGGRLGMGGAIGVYVIWKFARNQEAAGRFLLALVARSEDIVAHSEFVNLPAFSKAAPGLERIASAADFPEHHTALFGAEEWSANVGFPGHANPAAAEVVNKSLVPQMFARAVRRAASPEEAVRSAAAKIERIYQDWRDRQRI